MDHLRETGQATSGPKAFGPRDRSNFLSALDNSVTRLRRAGATTGGDLMVPTKGAISDMNETVSSKSRKARQSHCDGAAPPISPVLRDQ